MNHRLPFTLKIVREKEYTYCLPKETLENVEETNIIGSSLRRVGTRRKTRFLHANLFIWFGFLNSVSVITIIKDKIKLKMTSKQKPSTNCSYFFSACTSV